MHGASHLTDIVVKGRFQDHLGIGSRDSCIPFSIHLQPELRHELIQSSLKCLEESRENGCELV